MLQIAICDDDVKCTTKIEEIIQKTAKEKGIHLEIDVFDDGLALFEYIEKNQVRYDILFLDIEMEEMDGLEVAKRIRNVDEIVCLIYVTSHTDYAIAAYEVQPFQFIVKPFEDDIVKKYFFKAYEKISRGNLYFHYKFRKNFHKVLINDIMYFESDKRMIIIHLADGSIQKFYDKLNVINEQVSHNKADFWRIHRSLLVNARYIKEKSYNQVTLTDGTLLYISEDRKKDINMQYANMIERDM